MRARLVLLLLLLGFVVVASEAQVPGGNVISGGSGGGSGTVSGTTNTVAKFTSSTAVGNSLATDNGTTLTYTGTGGISTPTVTTTGSAGSITVTNIAAPSSPGAGTTSLFSDSTAKNLCAKNDTGAQFCAVTSTNGTDHSLSAASTFKMGTGTGASPAMSGLLAFSVPNSNPTATGSFTTPTGGGYTIPASGFAGANTRCVKVEAVWSTAANANTKAFQIVFGATAVISRSGSDNNTSIIQQAYVCRSGSNTQTATGWSHTLGGADATSFTTPGETESGTITVAAQGNPTTATTDITLRAFSVHFTN